MLDITASHIRPGITTDELDEICHNACIERNAYPSPLNYNKFPKSICTSVNEVICHGIPDKRPLVEGDIINLDVSLCVLQSILPMLRLHADHNGFHGDLNATYPVGKVDQESQDLIATTKRAMEEAIAICKPGVPYRDIGNKIEEITRPAGLSIVRRYTGHGIHHQVSHIIDSCGKVRADVSSTLSLISCTTADRRHRGGWRLARSSQ